jgi:cell division protein ZapA
MTKKNLVRVTIMNEEYAIRSDTSPEHTRQVASYLDDAIRRVVDSGTVVETGRASILAALQITAELFEARAGNEMTDKLKGLSDEIRRLLPAGKRAS